MAIAQIVFDDLKEEQLQKINPKVVAAIQSIKAEQMGKEPISWSDFSSHTTN